MFVYDNACSNTIPIDQSYNDIYYHIVEYTNPQEGKTMDTSYTAIQSRNGTATSVAIQHANHVLQNQTSQLLMITSEEQLRREKRRQKKWTVLIALVSLIGFFVALSAIIIEASTIAYVAFIFPIILGPYVIHQRRKLNKLPTLIFVMNQIRDQVNRLMNENNTLQNENIRLQQQVMKLHDIEQQLETVIQKSGHDVNTICTLVKENAETQRQMKKLLNAQELQTLLTAIIQSDIDHDHMVSNKEMDHLLLRLQTFSVIDTVKIRDALQALHNTDGGTSTTTLYNHLAISSFDKTDNDDEEGDFSLGYGDWLFEEA